MANSNLFKSASESNKTPVTNTVNDAGGSAYSFTHEHALAQAIATGTFADGFYVSAEDQLARLKEAASKSSEAFVARAAVWGHENGKMKDGPSALLAFLFGKRSVYTPIVFERVVTNGRMLRNFVQMVRSGKFGRKSLGSQGKRLIAAWFNKQTDRTLLNASVGNDPSLSDVMALAHPKPTTVERADFYGYLRGKTVDRKALPSIVQHFESFKAGEVNVPPDVEFRLLTGGTLTPAQWVGVALNMPWNALRQNLNTLARHGVFKDSGAVAAIVKKLEGSVDSRAHPYSLFAAYSALTEDVPLSIRLAVQNAAETATSNIQSFGVPTEVIVDVSGSMGSAVTGDRGSATSSMRCIDVAAFMAACIARKNACSILPVDTAVHPTKDINPRDSIMTIADRLRRYGGGGTDLGAAMRHLNSQGSLAEVIVVLSDNESWAGGYWGRGTGLQAAFEQYRKRVPKAKLICVDIAPTGSTQAPDSKHTLNIGGFSDNIFETIHDFVRGEAKNWVSVINQVGL